MLFGTITARIVCIISSVEGLQLHAESHRQQRGPEMIVYEKRPIKSTTETKQKLTEKPWVMGAAPRGTQPHVASLLCPPLLKPAAPQGVRREVGSCCLSES